MTSIVISAIELKRKDGSSVLIDIDEAKDIYNALHKMFGNDKKTTDLSEIFKDIPIKRDAWRDKNSWMPQYDHIPAHPDYYTWSNNSGAIGLNKSHITCNLNDIPQELTANVNNKHADIWQLQVSNAVNLIGPQLT